MNKGTGVMVKMLRELNIPSVTFFRPGTPMKTSMPSTSMSRKEKRLVSSQKKTSCTRLPDTTTPVIAPMKASRKAKKRGTGSSEDM